MPDRCKFARGRMITFFIATLMTTLKPDNHTEVQSDFGYGMLAGILGGACFGFIMQLTGMMGRYAEIVGGYKDIDGWFVHIVVSAILGAIYGAAGYRIFEELACFGPCVWTDLVGTRKPHRHTGTHGRGNILLQRLRLVGTAREFDLRPPHRRRFCDDVAWLRPACDTAAAFLLIPLIL